jgi:putative transcriptional regulator
MTVAKDVLTKVLRAYRALHNLTQEDMAEKMGIKVQTYVSKETGRTEFSASEAARLCRIFNVSFEDIFLLSNYEKIIVRSIPGTGGHGFKIDNEEG